MREGGGRAGTDAGSGGEVPDGGWGGGSGCGGEEGNELEYRRSGRGGRSTEEGTGSDRIGADERGGE